MKKISIYCISAMMSCLVCYFLCIRGKFNSLVITLLYRTVICCIIPNVLNVIFFRKTTEYDEMLEIADRMTKNRMHKIIQFLKCN